jgi:glycosyltransferase involved in cell wall biosynthesis
VLVLAHSPYGLARGRQLLGSRPDTVIAGPGLGVDGPRDAARLVLGVRPRCVYLADVGKITAAGWTAARAIRARVAVDTGDAAYALARSTGSHTGLGAVGVWAGERTLLHHSDLVVVRAPEHRPLLPLSRRVVVAPDLAPSGCRPGDAAAAKRERRLTGRYVVGLVGSIKYARRLDLAYGWDLLEALALLPEQVRGLVVGDGDGLEWLQAKAIALNVADRVTFAGRIAPSEVAATVAAMDVAISTQSNDRVGMVRTTGKLPLYLASGCPVIASHVGPAARILGPEGWTLRYDGVVDRTYPQRLAARVHEWSRDGLTARRKARAVELYAQHFPEAEIVARVVEAVDALAGTP